MKDLARSRLPGITASHDQDRRTYVWNNDRDMATLRNDHVRFIDDESWSRDRDRAPDHRQSQPGSRRGAAVAFGEQRHLQRVDVQAGAMPADGVPRAPDAVPGDIGADLRGKRPARSVVVRPVQR